MRENPKRAEIEVGSFGERLRREREMRGISLDDIADATKIGTRSLRALEEEHFELLPGGIFNKGFVRAYARYLGLNEDQAVADYLDGAVGFPIVPVVILLLFIAAGAGGWQIYQQRLRTEEAREQATQSAAANSSTPPGVAPSTASPTPSSGAQSRPPQAGTPATNPSDSTSGQADGSEPATAKGTNTNPAELNAPEKAAEPDASQLVAPAAEAPEPKTNGPEAAALEANKPQFEVTVRAKDRAWVSIKSDGKIAVRGIISPPDEKTIRATDQVVFWTGNAGAIDISFNGQRIALPGGPNTEGGLVFNSHGVVIQGPAASNREP
jgi:cytoskeleton protein RodZ